MAMCHGSWKHVMFTLTMKGKFFIFGTDLAALYAKFLMDVYCNCVCFKKSDLRFIILSWWGEQFEQK